jgi:hypothetical protein
MIKKLDKGDTHQCAGQSMQNRGNQSELPLVSGAPVALSVSLHITDSISES